MSKTKKMELKHNISKWKDENGNDFIADVSSSVITKRKGHLLVNRELILQADVDTLKVIFSNFFPLDVNRHHIVNYWDSIEYYGISEHFEEVEEACVAPTYEMWLKRDKNGKVKFDKMVKL